MKLKPTAAPTLKNRGELWWCTDPQHHGAQCVLIDALVDNDFPGMEIITYHRAGSPLWGNVDDNGLTWYGPVEIPEVEE